MHGRHMEGSAASISSSWALAATRNGPPCCARTGVATRSPAATTPTADYLLGTPHLCDHLESALDAFGVDVTAAEDTLM